MSPQEERNSGVMRATVIIAVFSLLAKILGLVRDAVFSHSFGTGTLIDAYFAAFRIPDFVFNLLILGTFSVAFIPIFSEYLIKDKKAADKLASQILNLTFLAIGALSLAVFIFVDPLVYAIAPGFTDAAHDLTKQFTKIFLLSPIFLTLSSIVSSMLNTHKRFAIVSIAPVFYNLSIIFGVVVLYPSMGPMGLAMGVVIGAFLHFAIQLPQLFAIGFRYRLGINFRDPGLIRFLKLYWPRIFSMGTGQITLLIATIFGSFLGAGALSAFYYANNLESVFLSIFAISSAIAVFPLLSDLYNQKDDSGFKDVLAKTTVQILFFMIPLSVLTLIMRAQIVRLVLGIGQGTNFTFADTRVVSWTLGLFSISLFAQALIPLFTRAFYARQNTAIPVIIGFISIFVNIVATYFLVKIFGIPGLALSFSVTSIITLIMLLMELHHKIGQIHDEYLIINSLKIVISAMLSGIATFLTLYAVAPHVNMNTYFGVLTQAAVAGSTGVIVYLIAGWIIGIDETHNLVKLLKSIFIKFAKTFNVNNWV